MTKKLLTGFLCALGVALPSVAFAHQPRLVSAQSTVVVDPEVSKAYYAQLKGEPQVYTIVASAPFELYVQVLVPALEGQKKDVSAAIIKDGDAQNPMAVLEGDGFEWTTFYEPFGADTYWRGPEYTAQVGAGTYEIRVWSSNNDSAYALAVGKKESFTPRESWLALRLIPQLKKDFFNESPARFIFSPLGWGLIVGIYGVAFVLSFLYGAISRQVVGSWPAPLSWRLRGLSAVVALGTLLFALMTSWNPLVILLSGVFLFEAVTARCVWCGRGIWVKR